MIGDISKGARVSSTLPQHNIKAKVETIESLNKALYEKLKGKLIKDVAGDVSICGYSKDVLNKLIGAATKPSYLSWRFIDSTDVIVTFLDHE